MNFDIYIYIFFLNGAENRNCTCWKVDISRKVRKGNGITLKIFYRSNPGPGGITSHCINRWRSSFARKIPSCLLAMLKSYPKPQDSYNPKDVCKSMIYLVFHHSTSQPVGPMKTPHATSAHLEAMGFFSVQSKQSLQITNWCTIHNKPNCAAIEQWISRDQC